MKERGIIFSAPMVRAILAGAKTQTRRIVKPQPMPHSCDGYRGCMIPSDEKPIWMWECPGCGYSGRWRCPFGGRGERLWVRETWMPRPDEPQTLFYRATDRLPWDNTLDCTPWKSPVFMPRVASRITLEITGVKVERVQDIDEGDAKREGFGGPGSAQTSRERFASLWDNLHGNGSWESNPWVWVIEFRRVEPTQCG